MSRIEINAGGRHVIVEHDGELSLEPLRLAALGLWNDTAGPERPPGPATGFQLTERRWTPPAQPSGMRAAPGPFPVQVNAESPPAEPS